jgi:hypothetical protein
MAIAKAPSLVACPPINPLACINIPPGMPVYNKRREIEINKCIKHLNY